MTKTDDALLVTLNVSELKQIISECVSTELDNRQTQDTNQEEILLSRKETANYFGVSLVTLRKWVACGVIKQYKVGGKVFFKKNEMHQVQR